MEQNQPYKHYDEDEIDLRELFNVLWAEKWLIVAVTAVFAVGSVIYALLQTDIYRAEALLAPAEEQQAGGAGQFAGAAALLGVNLGGGGGGTIGNTIATLQSRQFLERFVSENELSIDHQTLSGILSVNQNGGLITVAINWDNPIDAADWVNKLVSAINNEIRSQNVSEANSAIAYLRNQLETTQLVDMQRVFYQLIESQTRITMLANVREDYVLKVIDPAFVPEFPVEPRRSLIAIIGTMAGVLIAILFLLIRHYIKK